MSIPLAPHPLGEETTGFWFAEVESGSTLLWCLVPPALASSFPVDHTFIYEGQSYRVVEQIPFLNGLPFDHIALRLERSLL